MPGYVPTAFHKFQHKPPACAQDKPHPLNKLVYGKQIQWDTQQNSLSHLKYADSNFVQSINGTFLSYARIVDTYMITDLNEISTCQYALTQ